MDRTTEHELQIDVGQLAFSLAIHGIVMGVIALFACVTMVFFVTFFTEDSFKNHLPLFWASTTVLWVLLHYKQMLRLFTSNWKYFRITNDMSLLHGLEFIFLAFMIPYTLFYVAFPTYENATPRQVSLLFGPIMLVFATYHGFAIARFHKHVGQRDKLLVSATLMMLMVGLLR